MLSSGCYGNDLYWHSHTCKKTLFCMLFYSTQIHSCRYSRPKAARLVMVCWCCVVACGIIVSAQRSVNQRVIFGCNSTSVVHQKAISCHCHISQSHHIPSPFYALISHCCWVLVLADAEYILDISKLDHSMGGSASENLHLFVCVSICVHDIRLNYMWHIEHTRKPCTPD